MIHRNCKYYLNIDVFKGICKRTKERINADEKACSHFEKLPQCQYCGHFSLNGSQLGLCKGKTMAFPEMNATNCADFSWN